jgi:NAD(P)-dependent dehydrogenase (short-subunit alcohol dehydrogenase family)
MDGEAQPRYDQAMDPKRVLITGANKGIGLATAVATLQRGEDTFVYLGSRDRGRGEAARASLVRDSAKWAERVAVVELDVSRDESVAAAAEKVAPERLYGIVNNAGIGLSDADMATVLDVNTRGPRRLCQTFLELLDPEHGRIVNVSSAAGPMFVARCSPERQRLLTSPNLRWPDIEALMSECLALAASGESFEDAGLGDGSAYGLSKACLNAYTIELAREHPNLTINACTPGFIETDLTRHYAAGRSAEETGMKSPMEGTRASMHLLFGDPGGSGWYFGSDAQRSPLDRYRSPGDPPYTGD